MPRSDRAESPGGAALRAPMGLAVESSSTGDDVVLSFPLATHPAGRPRLTHAEEGVLEDLLLGFSNAEIAARRGVAVRTVANQLAGLFRKLGVHSRLEAARVAAERMSGKMPHAVSATAHPDPPAAQVSGAEDSHREKVTLFRVVDRMG